MINTGGMWDANAWPVYFLASSLTNLRVVRDLHPRILVAINELGKEDSPEMLREVCETGTQIFIDSGVFWLSTTHAKAHDMTMDQALSLAPEKIDGFAELFERYVSILSAVGDKVWGYIEIDQGGRENKIKTRAKLEALGLRPIPVYHPFNDGWDYFDYLGENYDRICFGNVVQADWQTRRRLMATAWERRKKYPHLWIHVLGFAPNEVTHAYPLQSCDSSSWLAGVRWGLIESIAANFRAWRIGRGFCYDREAIDGAKGGSSDGMRFGAYEGMMIERTMRQMWREEIGELQCSL
jgi:hypothetical protein